MIQYDTVQIKNVSWQPELHTEGTYVCSFPEPPLPEAHLNPGTWHGHLEPYQRLFYHQTMNSVRSSKRYRANPNIPKDTLDFSLQSRYDHTREAFPDKVDYVMQRETCRAVSSWSAPGSAKEIGSQLKSFRVLRNTRFIRRKQEDVLGHPLRIGGCKEKIHPHSVKLICSGVHNQLVNNGFSRQTSDGNFFRY
ncbi:protein C1orf194 [Drosophila mauritiana]|uniref:Protein C1orf194 n=1 Tax=Drosophila mauritiana TaxID=7226 RepID=A0A6P8JDN0_DROMA|nr:protein C1orf194 [Drosophila mauritiana]